MQCTMGRLLTDKGTSVEAIHGGATVKRAVDDMNACGIGSLLVTAGHQLLGIFTERDVLTRVVGRGLDPNKTLVEEVMTRLVITVTLETTIEEAMAVITEHRCRHLPVVAGDKVVGIVSSGDLTRWLIRDQRAEIDDLVGYIRLS